MKPNLRMKYYTAILSAFGTASMCTLTTAPAGAAEQAVPTRTVRFDDLDITKPAGAKILYDRIKEAAAEVCQLPTSWEPLSMLVVQRNCVQKAIDNAVMKVNSDVLTELRFGSGIRLANK